MEKKMQAGLSVGIVFLGSKGGKCHVIHSFSEQLGGKVSSVFVCNANMTN